MGVRVRLPRVLMCYAILLCPMCVQLRQSITASRTTLENAAQQFRAIQKRLLVRYKDKNPGMHHSKCR